MAYFAALLARTADGWFVRDSDLDDVEDLDTLADYLRKAAPDDESVLLFLEQEDLWFAVVRVDGEDDPRVFVSDAAAAARSSYGDTLLAGSDAATSSADVAAEIDLDESDEEYDEDEPPVGYPPPEPVGDAELLTDYGTSSEELLELCAAGLLPTDALTAIAEKAGFADELESVR